jgi:hypothetical protein
MNQPSVRSPARTRQTRGSTWKRPASRAIAVLTSAATSTDSKAVASGNAARCAASTDRYSIAYATSAAGATSAAVAGSSQVCRMRR